MLHMVVSTHNPESCPMADPAMAKKVLSANQRMADVAKKLSITIQGAWTDTSAHITFMIVDAPNAHVLNQMATELELANWNTSIIYPVVTMQEVMTHLQP